MSPRARLVTTLVSLALANLAKAQQPRIRASPEARGDVLVGQRVALVVELLAPGFFSGAAAFDLPDPPGLLIAPPVASPTVSSETIDGASYTVQRYELSVFARRPGPQAIPPLPVRFHYRLRPLDKEVLSGTLVTPPVRFTVKVPPGAEGLGSLLSSRDLRVTETWDPDPAAARLKAGDALTRTITFSASDVSGMAFPSFPAPPISGLAVYPGRPEVLDHADRGDLRGQRRDALTYVFERPGTFTIPPARLTWFNLTARKLETIDFPARTFAVAPNPALAGAAGEATDDATPETGVRRLAALAGAAAVAAIGMTLLVRRFGPDIVAPFRAVHLAPLNPTEQDFSP